MALSKVISFIAAKFKVSPEQIEAARVVIYRPPALLAVLKSVPPLPKEVLADPSLTYAYPAPFIEWSKRMHGLAEWDDVPALSYADYVAQMELAFMPTDIAVEATNKD
ncbi:hypothetical protein ACVW0Q_002052 [Thermostichus sp. MS-CIW-21]|jgi:hypothetical protein|uniref:hypothetical protein n=1 Tax=unclassified Synechococcus TaxID=2626047 RepID=UPI00006942D7|nr:MULTISPECIES: hypothetical protein [unclassified Synechococcus]ABC99305.1 hypothetical protein CYA_1117 [Synechococcus sp. JA-3-3Ab]PIK85356.1 hypothetical protein SYN63AY4M2_02150 [Synechococcus sp. 63AY4M2]PIK88611.1 hypothetical protein SYN65AY6A5_05890 [Synechococcus sp. 65AY6A5]PIK93044.1 hypothetical protein SYN65AY6LI_13075 [Synechococcus sp. 65AY6Li]PIK94400.1 hypothetical protein SYN60AY4M2_02610 [Synechococcus sp. 60AY4M2]